MPKLRPTPCQRAFWDELHAEIRKGGGVITSIPVVSPVWFECSIGSSLPDTLRQYGFPVQNLGPTEKFDAAGHKVTIEIHALDMMPRQ